MTVSHICLQEVKEQNLFENVLKELQIFFAQATENNLLNVESRYLKDDRWWRPYVDLKYIVYNKNVAKYLLVENPALFSKVNRSAYSACCCYTTSQQQ